MYILLFKKYSRLQNSEKTKSSTRKRLVANGVVVPVSSLHYFWCFAIFIFSGTWNCNHHIQQNLFKVLCSLSVAEWGFAFKKAAFPLYKSFAIGYSKNTEKPSGFGKFCKVKMIQYILYRMEGFSSSA